MAKKKETKVADRQMTCSCGAAYHLEIGIDKRHTLSPDGGLFEIGESDDWEYTLNQVICPECDDTPMPAVITNEFLEEIRSHLCATPDCEWLVDRLKVLVDGKKHWVCQDLE